MKLLGHTKKLIDKTRHGENLPSLKVVEVALMQCNLVDNQYQRNLRNYILLPLINLIAIL